MNKPFRVTYDEDVDAAYIYFTEIEAGGVAKTYCCDPSEVGGMINLDFDADGQLLGIEVVGAKGKLPAALLTQETI
jgi:uncharacterized protein YuzE